ncbi:2849_t:CDS:1 [Entrophospora sp. SA101]|nr:2849_t:CDS:1 [Entrophospora sp. SA101]
MESKQIQGQGYRLGSVREQELEDALRVSSKTNSELIDDFKNLQVVYSKFSKNIKQENAQLQRNLKQADTDIQQIRTHALQLISEIKRLRKEISVHKSQNNRQQIAMNDYDIKLDDIQNALSEKSKEAKSLQTKVKKLEKMKDKLSLKVSELEHLKSDAISRVLPLGEAISGGGEGSSLISSAIVEPLDLLKKNMRRDTSSAIAKSDVISAVDKPKLDFSKFLRKKTEIPEYAIKISEDNPGTLPHNMRSIESLVHIPQIKNVSEIEHEPHPQISMGGMEAIPAMASTILSPTILICLTYLVSSRHYLVHIYPTHMEYSEKK